ncbi:hypothetical protein ACIQZM_18085 [Peribacillus sp. NPDC097206]|uniref:hypothetical protein n=1 Tax=unclassified Peribacillus TaxID=2675266 RepID=UPI00381308A8
MYKSQKNYHSINLTKEDILELESILEDNFAIGNTRKNFNVETPNRSLEPMSMYGFFDEQVPKNLDSIRMKYTESAQAQGFSSVKYLSVSIYNFGIIVSIEGVDEVWVNGMAQVINTFFKEKNLLFYR